MIVPVTWSLNSELVRRVDAPQRSKNVGQVAANPAKLRSQIPSVVRAPFAQWTLWTN